MKAGWAALVAVLAAASCKRASPPGPPPPRQDAGAPERRAAPRLPEIAVVTGVSLRWNDGEEPAGFGGRELADQLQTRLVSSPPFLAAGDPVPPDRVAVSASVAVLLHRELVAPEPGDKSTGGSLLVGVEAELSWKKGGGRLRPRENVLAHRPLDRRDAARVDELTAVLLEGAVDEAAQGLIDKEALRQGDDAAVLAALDDDDPDQVLWALELAAERRLARAFDPAVALLDARDAGIRSAALRFLVALGDPRAVQPLARRADFHDPDTMRALVEAVTAIGGSEAIEFLELVAGGHEDPDMRQRAEEGLERLGRRQPQP